MPVDMRGSASKTKTYGALVAGQEAARVGGELEGLQGAAGPEHDERLRALAPLIVGYADDRHLEYGRVAPTPLHLDGGDVLAAGDDDVLARSRSSM